MSTTTDDVDTALQLLRNDPEAVVRQYPDRCHALAEKARSEGRHAIADRIESIVAEVTGQ